MTATDAGPAGFTTSIDNPYMTLRPGTTFVYEDNESGETNSFTVTRKTVVVDGVTCVVVHDTAKVNGVVIEDTFDWFAQDDKGNVWYFGEDTKAYEPGNPDPVSTEGSWEAGVDGAQAGIVMLADPDVGDKYYQEFAPGVAEDWAKVLRLDANVDVVYGSFGDTLKTRDVNPLDPSVENKYYVPGVGNVLTTDEDGNREQLVKIIVNGTGGADRLLGYAGGDVMNGGRGQDHLIGLTGGDTMRGGNGDDILNGGLGADDLSGGAGVDWLRGSGGADTFIIGNLNDGVAQTDTIADYNKSQIDVLDLPGGKSSIASDKFTNGAWELTLDGDGDTVRFLGVSDANNNGHIVDDLLIL